MAGFKNILGHEKVIESLQNALMLDKVSHAYILEGEEGSGKMTTAEAFAMALQCEKGGKDACMECSSCRQALTRNNPDIIYLQPTKERIISVDDIRHQINESVSIKPYSSKYKVYIVDHAEKMNEAAQNALLKTIEEPPQYVVILLLTTNKETFLPTIRSRCVALQMHPVSDELICNYLQTVLGVSEEEALLCTAFAQGNLGKAANLSGSEDFLQIKLATVQLMKRIKEIDLYELTQAVKQIGEYKLRISEYFDLMTIWFRDILVYKATSDANKLVFRDEVYDIKKQASISSYEGIQKIIDAIMTAKTRINSNVNLELALELMLLTIKEN